MFWRGVKLLCRALLDKDSGFVNFVGGFTLNPEGR